MSGQLNPGQAAQELATAWREGRQLVELPQDMRPATLSEGYDLQDAFVDRMGDRIRGWKLGVGSPAAMRLAGTQRALIGRLLESRCHKAGDTLIIPQNRPVTVEFEIVFELGRDIEPGMPIPDPMSAVSAIYVGFELVLSRFTDRRAVGMPSFAGDNVGFEAFVLGNEIDRAEIADVIATVNVSMEGVSLGRGLYGDDATDPVAALTHLCNHASERGITLHRGDLVTTGAAAKPVNVESGEFDISARYLHQTLSARISGAAKVR